MKNTPQQPYLSDDALVCLTCGKRPPWAGVQGMPGNYAATCLRRPEHRTQDSEARIRKPEGEGETGARSPESGRGSQKPEGNDLHHGLCVFEQIVDTHDAHAGAGWDG